MATYDRDEYINYDSDYDSKYQNTSNDKLIEILKSIRDVARSNLKPDTLTEKQYYEMKMRNIARFATVALKELGVEE